MKTIDGLTLEQIEKYVERVDHIKWYNGLSEEARKKAWRLPTIVTIAIMMLLAYSTPMVPIAGALANFPEAEAPMGYYENNNQHMQGYGEPIGGNSHAIYTQEYERKTDWAFFRFCLILFGVFIIIDGILFLPWFLIRPRYIRKQNLIASYEYDKQRIHRLYSEEIQKDIESNLKGSSS